MKFKYLLFLVMSLFLMSCGYNKLQVLEEEVYEAWGNLQAAYQRRADLVPNLVEVVKKYAEHEKDVLVQVTEARAKVGQIKLDAKSLGNKEKVLAFQKAQAELGNAISRLMVVVEKYPDLKANQTFLDLMSQLEGTENRINVARVRYNEAVKRFNSAIRMFPYNLTNKIFLHLERKEYFEADEQAKKAPKVKF